MEDLLYSAANRGITYLEQLDERSVVPSPEALAGLEQLGGPLPEQPTDPARVLEQLDRYGSPATVATAGPRYFGFVTGGALPATVAANWLAGAWDQIAGMTVMSPVASELERICLAWLTELLGLPAECGGGLVTGTTTGNMMALAAARHALLARAGWDVEARGLFGAPPLTVVVSDEVHFSDLKALAMLGLGRDRVVRVPTDAQGRIRADALPRLQGPTMVLIQAGNVNTGSFDPAREIAAWAHEAGAWLHVDGAFGLWAAASPRLAHLCDGVAEADSWATDAHKWLNVPYDSGIVFVREPEHLHAAGMAGAPYLPDSSVRQPFHWTPEASRRARGVEVWAALRSLGRSGVAELVERCCDLARRFAAGLGDAGFEILNDVVLNQVLVSFGDAERTRSVIAAVQADGTCWCGGTVWQGHTAMRISVSSWATTEEDVDRSVEAIVRLAQG